ncbi:MAG: TylF/MycF/NovP-related O-methyltransferase [Gemmobacter sp.]
MREISGDPYVDLLLRAILNEIYLDPPLPLPFLRRKWRRAGFDVAKLRATGQDWPSVAHSMIGRARMENLRFCVETALDDGVPGDLIETGVWRGGACILMRGILRARAVTDRTVWVADSFAGLPPPDAAAYPADAGDLHHTMADLAVPLEEVQRNFALYGLLDDQVRFLKGWFRDTLPGAPIGQLAVLRLDGDMYESTTDALRALYHKVAPGGFVIVDDYHAVAGCKAAVHDHLATLPAAAQPEIREIDGTGVYWRLPAV